MGSHYKVSVIIPCFNAERSLLLALDSIVQQSHIVHEIICIDDCSSDNTVKVIQGYTKFPITLIKNETNKGPSFARNKGVELSSGDVLAFLDSDDIWHKDKLHCQLAVMRYFDYDFVSCSYSDTLTSRVGASQYFKSVSLQSLFLRNIFCTPSVVMKQSIFSGFDTDMQYSEDYDHWLRISKKGVRMAFLNRDLVILSKPAYGASGLSSHLFRMEKGELRALLKNSTGIEAIFYMLLSILKFSRRLIISKIR